jgi:hypothetical protein
MSTHFLPRMNFRHGNTWSMEWEGTIIRSRCDYILGTDQWISNTYDLKIRGTIPIT